jgi:hypothetical protein
MCEQQHGCVRSPHFDNGNKDKDDDKNNNVNDDKDATAHTTTGKWLLYGYGLHIMSQPHRNSTVHLLVVR